MLEALAEGQLDLLLGILSRARRTVDSAHSHSFDSRRSRNRLWKTPCSKAELTAVLARAIAARGRSVNEARRAQALAAFAEEGSNVDAAAFWQSGLAEYVGSALSDDEFFQGEPVLMATPDGEELGGFTCLEQPCYALLTMSSLPSPPLVRTGVVRAVDKSGCDMYTIDTGGGEIRRVAANRLRPATGHALDAAKDDSARDYLEAVAERVGADPGGEHWKAEVPAVIREWLLLRGVISSLDADDAKSQKLLEEAPPWTRSFDGVCGKYSTKNSRKAEHSGGSLTLEDAQLLTIFDLYGRPLAAAAQGYRKDYAGLTHRFYCMLARIAATAAEPAADCYKHLEDTRSKQDGEDTCSGLAGKDPGWVRLVRDAIDAVAGGRSLNSTQCMTAVGTTIVMPAEPRFLVPSGFRQRHAQKGGEMVVQDSPVVRFLSYREDNVGLHSAVYTDPNNCVFPPMTLFTVVDVQLDAFEYDGTKDLLRECVRVFGGRSPPLATAGTINTTGRPHIGRDSLIIWMAENASQVLPINATTAKMCSHLQSGDAAERQAAMDCFYRLWWPPGTESTIYTVHQTLVTVQATYLLPTTAAAGGGCGSCGGGGGDGGGLTVAAGGGHGPGKADEVYAKLMADSTKLV